MKSFVTEVLVASLVLSTLIGAETAYAYSNIIAGSHPLPSPEMVFRSARPAPTTSKGLRTTQQPRNHWPSSQADKP